MKAVSRALLIVFVTTFFLSAVSLTQPSSGAHCSTAAAAGRWAFTSSGSVPALGPVAAVARFTADAAGNITGSQTRSLNGNIADETFTGTQTVNSDCTGEVSVQVFENGALVRTTTLNVVFEDNVRSARGIFTSLVLPDGTVLPAIITLDAKRLFPED